MQRAVRWHMEDLRDASEIFRFSRYVKEDLLIIVRTKWVEVDSIDSIKQTAGRKFE